MRQITQLDPLSSLLHVRGCALKRDERPDTCRRVFSVDGGKCPAPEEKGQAPVESGRLRIRSCEIAVCEKRRVGREQILGVGDTEIDYAGRPAATLDGGGQIQQGGRTVEIRIAAAHGDSIRE